MGNLKSYWHGNGQHQAAYQKIWNAQVPASGEAKTVQGELIRICGRFIYEHSNNGNCNALDYDGENLAEMWLELMEYVVQHVPNIGSEAEAVTGFIIHQNYACRFNQKEYDLYNKFCDKIIEHALKLEI